MTRTLTYSIAGGSIERLTQAETQSFMVSALTELEQVCDVKFKRLNRGGNFRFGFRPESEQHNGALGNAYSNGVIYLASTTARDRWRMDLPYRRTLQTVTQHEIICHPPIIAIGHTDELRGVAGPTANVDGPSPSEVRKLQEAFGKPPNRYTINGQQVAFFPIGRTLINARKAAEGSATQAGSLEAEWERLKQARNAEQDKTKRAALHRQVLSVLERLKSYHQAWWSENNAWVNTPGAHVQRVQPVEQAQLMEAIGYVEPIYPIAPADDTLQLKPTCGYIDEDGVI